MSKLLQQVVLIPILVVMGMTLSPSQTALAACDGGSVLGVPHWYKYLPKDTATSDATGKCVAEFKDVGAIVLVVFAIIEIAIRVAMYIGIIFFIYGAIRMTVSQGSPEEVNKARGTIINALIGVAIGLVATAVVNFIGAQLG